MKWREAVERGLRDCNVYEDFIPRISSWILGFLDEEGLCRDSIRRGLRLGGVEHDDIEFMTEKVYQACLEAYSKGELR